jgi:hypothetical protein
MSGKGEKQNNKPNRTQSRQLLMTYAQACLFKAGA